MFAHTFRVAIRNLLRNKVYTLINLTGLTVGVSCCLLLLLFVQHEMTYDRFHPQADRLYRLALNRVYPDHQTEYAVIPHSIGEAAQAELPEVKSVTRLFPVNGSLVFKQGEEVFEEKEAVFADSNFFQVFGAHLLTGNEQDVLTGQQKVVLTQVAASRYFGSEDPVGKVIESNFGLLQVTGVCENYPEKSHLDFEVLISLGTLNFIRNTQNYISFSTHTYLVLEPATQPSAVEVKMPEVVQKYAAGQIQRQLGVSYDDYHQAGNGYDYFLQPVANIHLDSHLQGEIHPNGNRTYVYLFFCIALFILLIACINFMNLTTARSAERAKEVGMRKVLGSRKSQLIWQFLAESIVIAAVSVVIALGGVYFLLPLINNWLDLPLSMQVLMEWEVWVGIIAFAVTLGIFSGSYPAFFLSGYGPAHVLKGSFTRGKTGTKLRNGLVVFQFTISVSLIIATLVVQQQMDYTQEKELGFAKDQLVVIERTHSLAQQAGAFRAELLKLPGVEAAGYTGAMPGGYYFGMMFQFPGDETVHTMQGMTTDEYFTEAVGIDIVEGRSFDPRFNDSLSIILNQAAVADMGITDPVGRRITHNNDGNPITYTIIGVAQNFHFESLHTAIGALAITHASSAIGNPGLAQMALRISPRREAETLASMAEVWQGFVPDQPFAYRSFDQDWEGMYKYEYTSGELFATFAALAILIACIGLLGLSAYNGQLRNKEMSIRKILGASPFQLLGLLSRDTLLLILLAILLAVPISWWGMQQWLEQFAYHANLRVETFVLAGALVLAVSWLTSLSQTLKLSYSNPSESLRTE
ncbi:MAG: ABC transporter permease [Bacteroidota bacterium]